VTNPTDSELALEVSLGGHGLTGASSLVLPAHSRDTYQVTFAPTQVGRHDGRYDHAPFAGLSSMWEFPWRFSRVWLWEFPHVFFVSMG